MKIEIRKDEDGGISSIRLMSENDTEREDLNVFAEEWSAAIEKEKQREAETVEPVLPADPPVPPVEPVPTVTPAETDTRVVLDRTPSNTVISPEGSERIG